MPRSSGTYTAPASSWNPPINGSPATLVDWSVLLADNSAAHTQAISRDGQSPALANLPMGSFKLTGLAAGTTAGDSVRFEQAAASGANADITSLATLTALNTGPLGGLRNALTNGNFDVWQRGITFASIAVNQYLADCWVSTSATPSTSTCQRAQSIDLPGSYSFQWNSVSTAARFQISQVIEAVNVAKYSGKLVTVSCKLQGNAGCVRSVSVALYKNATGDTLTGGTWTSIGSAAITLTTLTQTVSFSVVVPNDGTANGLKMVVSDAAAGLAGDIIFACKANIEIGSVVTPIDQRLYGLELLLCQRFFWRLGNTGALLETQLGIYLSTTLFDVMCPLPVTMRATPTVTSSTWSWSTSPTGNTIGAYYGSYVASSHASIAVAIGASSANAARLRFTGTGGAFSGPSAGAAIELSVGSSVSFDFSAELQ